MDGFEQLIALEEKDSDFTQDDRISILDFATNEDDLIRSKAISLLINFNDQEAKKILIHALKDPVELVRVEAADSLSTFADSDVVRLLLQQVHNEESSLVRGYIISTLGLIGETNTEPNQILEFLSKLKKTEQTPFCMLNIYYSLYLLGEKKYLHEISNFLNHPEYTIRCSVCNMLLELLSHENCKTILSVAKKQQMIEPTRAVAESLNELVDACERMPLE